MKTSAEQMVESYKADERTAQVNEKGLAACGVAAIFYVTFRIIYVGFRGGLAVPELVLLFVMAAMMSLVKKKNNLQELPVLFGRRLDPAPEAFPKRLLLYVLSALRLSVAWTLLDVFGKVTGLDSMPLTVVMDLTLGTLIFALIDMLINEKQIRAYRREQARLDAEENRLY